MPEMTKQDSPKYSRRDFIKTLGAGLAAAALPSLGKSLSSNFLSYQTGLKLGRVASSTLSVYKEPSDTSQILFQRFLDDILNIYQTVESEDGPAYNPYWHRVWGGYVHSAFVQDVRNQLNDTLNTFPSSGQLMELTVPYSQSYRIRSGGKWEEGYRLYYGSTYWVFSVIEGKDGESWYEIRDGLVALSYYVPAAHLRPVSDEELAPINPHVASRINVLRFRSITKPCALMKAAIWSGKRWFPPASPALRFDPDALPTDTPKGDHIIRSKKPSVHMGDGTLRSDAEAYELPGVPWVSYFEMNGYAIHGTYWHNNFGIVMSHGCVNMRSDDAKWIYRWSTPYPGETDVNNVYHTPVDIT